MVGSATFTPLTAPLNGAVLALVGKLVVAPDQPWLLIVADDGRAGEGGHVAGGGPAEVVAPDGLRRDARVRGNAEVAVGPDALHEVRLRRIGIEILEAVGTGNERSVELTASLEGGDR